MATGDKNVPNCGQPKLESLTKSSVEHRRSSSVGADGDEEEEDLEQDLEQDLPRDSKELKYNCLDTLDFCELLEKFESVVSSFMTEFMELQIYDAAKVDIPRHYNLKLKIKLMNHILKRFEPKVRKVLQEEVLGGMCHIMCNQRRIYKNSLTNPCCSDYPNILSMFLQETNKEFSCFINRIRMQHLTRVDRESLRAEMANQQLRQERKGPHEITERPASPRVIPDCHYNHVLEQVFRADCCGGQSSVYALQRCTEFPPPNAKLPPLGLTSSDQPNEKCVQPALPPLDLDFCGSKSLRSYGTALGGYGKMKKNEVQALQTFEESMLNYTLTSKCVPVLWCGNNRKGQPMLYSTHCESTLTPIPLPMPCGPCGPLLQLFPSLSRRCGRVPGRPSKLVGRKKKKLKKLKKKRQKNKPVPSEAETSTAEGDDDTKNDKKKKKGKGKSKTKLGKSKSKKGKGKSKKGKGKGKSKKGKGKSRSGTPSKTKVKKGKSRSGTPSRTKVKKGKSRSGTPSKTKVKKGKSRSGTPSKTKVKKGKSRSGTPSKTKVKKGKSRSKTKMGKGKGNRGKKDKPTSTSSGTGTDEPRRKGKDGSRTGVGKGKNQGTQSKHGVSGKNKGTSAVVSTSDDDSQTPRSKSNKGVNAKGRKGGKDGDGDGSGRSKSRSPGSKGGSRSGLGRSKSRSPKSKGASRTGVGRSKSRSPRSRTGLSRSTSRNGGKKGKSRSRSSNSLRSGKSPDSAGSRHGKNKGRGFASEDSTDDEGNGRSRGGKRGGRSPSEMRWKNAVGPYGKGGSSRSRTNRFGSPSSRRGFLPPINQSKNRYKDSKTNPQGFGRSGTKLPPIGNKNRLKGNPSARSKGVNYSETWGKRRTSSVKAMRASDAKKDHSWKMTRGPGYTKSWRELSVSKSGEIKPWPTTIKEGKRNQPRRLTDRSSKYEIPNRKSMKELYNRKPPMKPDPTMKPSSKLISTVKPSTKLGPISRPNEQINSADKRNSKFIHGNQPNTNGPGNRTRTAGTGDQTKTFDRGDQVNSNAYPPNSQGSGGKSNPTGVLKKSNPKVDPYKEGMKEQLRRDGPSRYNTYSAQVNEERTWPKKLNPTNEPRYNDGMKEQLRRISSDPPAKYAAAYSSGMKEQTRGPPYDPRHIEVMKERLRRPSGRSSRFDVRQNAASWKPRSATSLPHLRPELGRGSRERSCRPTMGLVDETFPLHWNDKRGKYNKLCCSEEDSELSLNLECPQENFFWVPLGRYSWEMRNIKVWKSQVIDPREGLGSKEYMGIFPEIKLHSPLGNMSDIDLSLLSKKLRSGSDSCCKLCSLCLLDPCYCQCQYR